jgi:hypothetical protein
MDNDSLSVISDYDCEDGATAIQKHWRRQAAKVFFLTVEANAHF